MKKSYLNVYIGMLVFAFFGIVFPLTLTFGNINSELMVFYLIILYASFRLSLILWSERLRLLESTFFIFVYVFLGIAPLLQVLHHSFPWRGIYDYTSILFAGCIILLGIVGYDAGIYLSKKNKQVIINSKDSSVNLKVLIVLGIACFLLGMRGLGGFGNLFLPRNELAVAISGASSTSNLLNTALLRVPIFIASIYGILLFKSRNYRNIFLKSNFKLLFWTLLTVFITLIASNPISSSRYWFGTVSLSYLFITLKWKKHTQPIIIVSILLIILVIFPYSDVFRNSTEFNFQPEDIVTTYTKDGDFDAFQQIINISNYTESHGFSYGKQLLGSVLFFIPRSIWATKPIGTGATVAEAIGYQFTNVSAPLWGEFFVNFGMFGVITLFVLYGWISGRLQTKFIESQKTKVVNFHLVFVPIFSAYQLFLLRGDLLSSFANLAPIIIFIMIGLRVKLFKNALK